MRRPLDRWILSVALLCLACQAPPEQVAAPPLPRSIDPVVSIARLTSGVSALGHPYRWYADRIAPVVEERLRTLPGSFVEMIVLLRVDGESSHGDRLEVFVAHDRAELRYFPFRRDPAFFRRMTSPAELAALRAGVSALQTPPESSISDGSMLMCCRVTADAVKTVSAHEPSTVPGGRPWLELQRCWDEWLQRPGWTLQLIPIPQLPGLRVDYAAPCGYVGGAWAQGDDIRVRVHARRRGSWRPGLDLTATYEDERPPRWVALKDGALGGPTTAPDRHAQAAQVANDAAEEAWQTQRMHDDIHGEVVGVETGGRRCVVRRGKRLFVYEDAGETFREVADAPEDVVGFRFLRDLGGGQLLLGRPMERAPPWSPPQPPMALDLLRVDLEEPGCFEDGLRSPHPFFQPVAGGFQPAGEDADLVWAAWLVDDPSARWTVIGRYHLSLLTFVECSEELDGLRFITDELWVDEAAQRVYVLSDGALLSFPLPALSKPR